jgi:hypothetical protein
MSPEEMQNRDHGRYSMILSRILGKSTVDREHIRSDRPWDMHSTNLFGTQPHDTASFFFGDAALP